VIATVGDGSYMFGNPLPYHYVGRSREPVHAHHHHQQHDVGAVALVDLMSIRTAAPQRPNIMPIDGTSPVARLRKGGGDVWRPRRKGHERGGSVAGAGTGLGGGAGRAPVTLNVMTQAR